MVLCGSFPTHAEQGSAWEEARLAGSTSVRVQTREGKEGAGAALSHLQLLQTLSIHSVPTLGDLLSPWVRGRHISPKGVGHWQKHAVQ